MMLPMQINGGCPFLKQSRCTEGHGVLKNWKCKMNMSCTLAEWSRGALLFLCFVLFWFVCFSIKPRLCAKNKVAFTVGLPQVCVLPARRVISCSLQNLCYCLRTSSYKHLFNNGIWLFNILFDFCFMAFLIEPCFNCLFYAPRAWVRKEGLYK